MNAWTDDFIAQCLRCIPDRSYRRRLGQRTQTGLCPRSSAPFSGIILQNKNIR
ncbi:hypothetical protein ACTQ4E_06725 [Lawsonibacter sp. LCP25S3_G6]|uniref:hypothetical protein n=1 Tax=unclassified Lawsonibacter TaxID=2617946 RepID=UPI003F9499DF